MKNTIIIMGIILGMYSTCLADRFEYIRYVNRQIPDDDSTGVRDTIFVTEHIQIQDVNFYVGVGTPESPSAEDALIDVFSPARQRVRLNDWEGPRINWYDVWYDTQRQVDGPGSLQDYNGGDSYGAWEMFCFDPFWDDSLFWYSWRIEIYGDLITGISEPKSNTPTDYTLKQIYPNPFNNSIMIEFGSPDDAEVSIVIYDILGRQIRTVLNSQISAGYHSIVWNGVDSSDKPVSSGVYLIRLTASDKNIVQKATLLK